MLVMAASMLVVWTIAEPKCSDMQLSKETLEAVYDAAATIPDMTYVSVEGNTILITVRR